MNISNVNVTLHCAHQLSGVVPGDHACGRLHGHSYQISVEASYENNPSKLLMDFGLVKKLIKDKYDHRFLNDEMKTPPTAENLAREICELLTVKFPDVIIRHVTVGETENNVTTYIPEDAETGEEE